MNPSRLFIEKPIMTVLLMAALTFFGLLTYDQLPISALPNVNYPAMTVSITYPGASPTTMANSVVSPLERQFLTIGGLRTIASTSGVGSANIVLQFDLSKKIDSAALDVQAAINAATPNLPEDLPHVPTYNKVNPAQTPILYFALTSATMPRYQLYDYAYTLIGQRLSTINGVAQVQVYGSPFAVRVQVNPQKLAAKKIGLDEVAKALSQANTHLPTGALYGSQREYILSTNGQLYETESYNDIIIKNEQQQIVRIKDVGTAISSISDDKQYQQFITDSKSQDSVIFGVLTQPDANSVEVIAQIEALLPYLQSTLPGSIEMKKIFDKSHFIEESVFDVKATLIITFILVVCVIFFYFGNGLNTLIPAITIPLAVIGTFSIMFLLGLNVDILSLLAITLSLGFLVDDAIVVLENIIRHVEMGKSSLQAALDGSKEIGMTIVSMTFSLSSIFIPLFGMQGVIGELFYEFSLVIIIAIILSGIISLTLTPMLCSRFSTIEREEKKHGWMQKISFILHQNLLNAYQKSLEKALKFPKTIAASGIMCVVGALLFFHLLPSDFLPPDDLGLVMIRTQAEAGTSPEEMKNIQMELDQKIRSHPAVKELISIAAFPDSNKGGMFVNLKPSKERDSIFTVMEEFKKMYETCTKAKIYIKPLPLIDLQVGTSSTNAAYQYTLQSLNTEDLYTAADHMMSAIKDIPTVRQVSSDMELKQPLLEVSILRDKAEMLKVSAQSVESVLSYAFAASPITLINRSQNQYDVILEVDPQFYSDPTKLKQLYVRSITGDLVPLTALMDVKTVVGPLNINRINGMPAVNIFFDIGKDPLGPVLEQIDAYAKQLLPSTVIGSAEGTAKVFQSSFTSLYLILLVALFVVYVILGVLYEDFFHPITVMSTLPPAALGGLVTLFIFREPLSLYAFVGLILLLGIVMKNGIIMIDFAITKLEEKVSPYEAIVDACIQRFRPILMTTFSALMGAVPIAIGIGGMTAHSRRSLGLVIIGGLVISQIITLYLTPVLYIILENIKRKWIRS